MLTIMQGMLQVSRDQQKRMERLEIALETLVNCPELDWKDTAAEVMADLNEFDNENRGVVLEWHKQG